VGPRRGDDQCSHTRLQTKEEDNYNYRALKGNSRYEEAVVRFENVLIKK
jgi:hypothetical protein